MYLDALLPELKGKVCVCCIMKTHLLATRVRIYFNLVGRWGFMLPCTQDFRTGGVSALTIFMCEIDN